MSFSGSGSGGEPSELSRRFVSAEQLEERRKQRQEEWDKARQPHQPEEVPEVESDNRSLYDKLQMQKTLKEEEKAEKFKFKNQVRGLEDDEATFLDFVSDQQVKHEKEREREEKELIEECKNALMNSTKTSSSSSAAVGGKTNVAIASKSQYKGQSSLLSGAVKRKSSDTDLAAPAEKKVCEGEGAPLCSNGDETARNLMEGSSGSVEPAKGKNNPTEGAKLTGQPQTMTVIGILPGIGHYTDSSDDSSNSEAEDDVCSLDGARLPTASELRQLEKQLQQHSRD